MIQTINLIKKAGSKRKIIAIANLELDTLQDEETIKESYENVLDDSLKTAQKKTRQGYSHWLSNDSNKKSDGEISRCNIIVC